MGLRKAFRAFFQALKETDDPKKMIEQREAVAEKGDLSHLRLLQLLQGSGRLIDFLKEDITVFSDAQVGAAVRKIHADCSKRLEELVTVRPVMEEKEGQEVDVAEGYDPVAIKIVGNVKGKGPFRGRLVHAGWRAHKRSLPKQVGENAGDVIQPAEIEVK